MVNNCLKEFWGIYIDSFPLDERRNLEDQKEIMKNDKYNIIGFFDNGELIGFLAYWDLCEFIFIEHFAFSSKVRKKGLGSKYLRKFIEKVDKKIILEVEPQSDDITFRRICFYKRLGFKLNEYDYYQPPFDEDKQPVTLQIMSYDKELKYEEFQFVKDKLYKYVYNYY